MSPTYRILYAIFLSAVIYTCSERHWPIEWPLTLIVLVEVVLWIRSRSRRDSN